MIVVPESLFRYRPISSKSWANLLDRELKSLEKAYLWFSSFEDLNDPMEGYIEHSIDSTIKQLGLLADTSQLADVATSFLDTRKTTAVCSMSTSYENGMMWSLYANTHQGLCIEYEPKSIMNWMVESMPLLKVAYSQKPPTLLNSPIDFMSIIHDQNFEQVATSMLATKVEHWRGEEEFRFIKPNSGKFYHHIEAIKSITIGAKQNEAEAIYKVKSTANKIGVPVYKANLNGYRIDREIIFQPELKPGIQISSEAKDKSKKIIQEYELDENLIPATEHAYMSAMNDPHCTKINDFGFSCTKKGQETLFFNYECNRPNPENLAEANRRTQMKFRLIDKKSKRDWSVRKNASKYS